MIERNGSWPRRMKVSSGNLIWSSKLRSTMPAMLNSSTLFFNRTCNISKRLLLLSTTLSNSRLLSLVLYSKASKWRSQCLRLSSRQPSTLLTLEPFTTTTPLLAISEIFSKLLTLVSSFRTTDLCHRFLLKALYCLYSLKEFVVEKRRQKKVWKRMMVLKEKS